jgi:hypothetical protein
MSIYYYPVEDASTALQEITSTDGSITVSQAGTTVDLAVASPSGLATNVVCLVRNNTGATLTKGTAVYINGAIGQNPTVTKAIATSDSTSAQTLGVMTADLANNSNGYVTIIGLVTDLNTSAFTDGQQLYLSPTTAGTLTSTKQYAPNHLVYVAVVEHAHPTQGKLFVKVQNGYEMDEIHDVSAQSPSTGQTLVYNAASGLWEKSNSPIITGGTINGTTIGATTPAAGTFTTITGQTEVLKGTGQNLYTYSNTFSDASWAKNTCTINTTVATNDPLGSTNAWKLIANNGVTLNVNDSAGGFSRNGNTSFASTTTFSFYAKSAEVTSVRVRESAETGNRAVISLSTGSVTYENGTSAQVSYVVTDVGNGWWRIAATRTSASAVNDVVKQGDTTGNGTNGIYVFGAQLELGLTANTYIPTTTTAVYGTPTLSFSGVSTLGLESNGALYLQPAGTGALQAQATTSTTVGGNARGANAVDWQTSRGNAVQVSSGAFASLLGGTANSSQGFGSATVGGNGNGNSGTYAFVGGGQSNSVSGFISGIVGGFGNTAAGYYNFIGGGFTNSGTANAAVTTQSGTMNATTAVTLSGSNANIKVGQYITGTSIANNTYVAAISGTSLTLSQNASGSSTSTLSFYTPHGVVVGGGNNQATGSYSFIGGGGDAGTAANRNVASGDWSVVGGGRNNIASGAGSVVSGGGVYAGLSAASNLGNTASGDGSFIGGGFANQAQSFGSSILGGYSNIANASYSVVLGSTYGTTRLIQGNTVIPASISPVASSNGSSQAAVLILGAATTDATATALRSNTSAAGTTNQVILPNNSAYFFRGEVVSGVTGGGDTKGWTIEGVIKRGAGVGTTALVGTPTVTSLYADAGAATWALAVTADTTNGGIRVTFTGQASTTIRTVCQIRTTEMTY